jgi:uncharacterized protein YjbI with pentapeptide repeats
MSFIQKEVQRKEIQKNNLKKIDAQKVDTQKNKVQINDSIDKQIRFNVKELNVDCERCFGLCCVALYFSASEGFPTNKEAGKPCINLQSDFTCTVHKDLIKKGLKGCIAYDCIGAGQKVAQVTYKGQDWRMYPEYAKQMFDVFLVMKQLHEMLWYLNQAYILQRDPVVKEDIKSLLESTNQLTLLQVEELLALDLESHRLKVNQNLKLTSEHIRSKASGDRNKGMKNKPGSTDRKNYFGADLRKVNLLGADLRGACLIATNLRGVDLSYADLIAADLRDANLCGADLSRSIFLTQAQINTTKGDANTKLPELLLRPINWV